MAGASMPGVPAAGDDLAGIAERGARGLDALCLGRAGMDLYARERNVDFADVTGFDKHVGGSPANVAVGMARLGARAGIVTKLSEDVVGGYVRRFLDDQGVDTRGVRFDGSGTRTSLALTEMRPDGCAVVIYRNDAADLALAPHDVDEGLVTDAHLLVVSGTALCREPSRSAARRAMRVAAEHDVRIVLDLDYRAYTWASVEEAGRVCGEAAMDAWMLVGNREEFAVLGLPEDLDSDAVAARCLAGATRVVAVKAGGEGATVFTAGGLRHVQPIDPVDAVKPFGAGDAWLAALLVGALEGRSLAECARRGAAAAAIVVAGEACSSSSPTRVELDAFIAARDQPE